MRQTTSSVPLCKTSLPASLPACCPVLERDMKRKKNPSIPSCTILTDFSPSRVAQAPYGVMSECELTLPVPAQAVLRRYPSLSPPSLKRTRYSLRRKVARELGSTHQSSRLAACTFRLAREEKTVARAGTAKTAREPKVARAPRTADTAVTEEVVRAAISREVSGTEACRLSSVRNMTTARAGENLDVSRTQSGESENPEGGQLTAVRGAQRRSR